MKLNQKGFSIPHILPAFVLVAAIAFVGGNVYQNQVKKREAARQAAIAEEAFKKQAELTIKENEETAEKEVEVPAPAPEQKPVETAPAPKTAPAPAPKPAAKPAETKPSYTMVNFSSHNVAVDGDNVTITMTLPGAYSGVCAVKVKLMPYVEPYQYDYKEASFSNANTCAVTFSKATLSAKGTSWKAFPSWRNNEWTVKGGYDGFEFNL